MYQKGGVSTVDSRCGRDEFMDNRSPLLLPHTLMSQHKHTQSINYIFILYNSPDSLY